MAVHAPLRVVFAEDSHLVRADTAALLAQVDAIDLVRVVDDPYALPQALRSRSTGSCAPA